MWWPERAAGPIRNQMETQTMTDAVPAMPADALAPFQDRLTRLQREMAAQQIDVTLIGPSSDFRYLTGHAGHTSERLTMLVVPQSGPVSVAVPTLEAPLILARRQLFDVSALE